MKQVFLLIDKTSREVVALYSTKEVAEKMLKTLEKKFETELEVSKRSIDLEINLVGVKK